MNRKILLSVPAFLLDRLRARLFAGESVTAAINGALEREVLRREEPATLEALERRIADVERLLRDDGK
jgi:hypothetical protein